MSSSKKLGLYQSRFIQRLTQRIADITSVTSRCKHIFYIFKAWVKYMSDIKLTIEYM